VLLSFAATAARGSCLSPILGRNPRLRIPAAFKRPGAYTRISFLATPLFFFFIRVLDNACISGLALPGGDSWVVWGLLPWAVWRLGGVFIFYLFPTRPLFGRVLENACSRRWFLGGVRNGARGVVRSGGFSFYV
jgi:hypothetical protein